MPLAGLVAHVAHESLLVAEARRQLLRAGEPASRVAPHVEYQSVAGHQVEEHLVEVAAPQLVLEGGAAYVAHIVVENAVFHARCDAVVGAEVAAQQRVADVARMVLVPGPVASHVVGCVEVDVAVAQLREHVGHHFECLCAGHGVVYLPGVLLMHSVPVHTFLREEAVVLVHDAPQGLEVAPRGVVELLFVDASRQKEQGEQKHHDSLHRCHLLIVHPMSSEWV